MHGKLSIIDISPIMIASEGKPTGGRRIRFSLRFLLTFSIILAIVTALVVRWTTKPFVAVGKYRNGTIAWEMWQRRTITGKIIHLRTVRYYTNGRKSYEYSAATGERFWSPDGKQMSDRARWYGLFRKDRESDLIPNE
jgi:hypothetical protein